MTAGVYPLGRAIALLGVSLLAMGGVAVAMWIAKPANAGLDLPWLSVWVSLVGVLAPTLLSYHWPRRRAPGGGPAFGPFPVKAALVGALASLPLYAVFAALQIACVKLLGYGPAGAAAEIVEPLRVSGPGSAAWLVLSIALLPAVTEEILYRGTLQPAMLRRFGPLIGLLLTSLAFAIMHFDPAGFPSRWLMGLWFGYLAWRTGSVWPGLVAHALNNAWGVAFANLAPHVTGPWAWGVGVLLSLAFGGAVGLMHETPELWPRRRPAGAPPGFARGAHAPAGRPRGAERAG